MYYTSNQPTDSNIPLAIINNWPERMCNIIPLQQKPILDTHSHLHTCLLLRSYKVIHCAIVTVQTGKVVFLQSKFIQKHKNIYYCVDSSLSGRHATSHIFCISIVFFEFYLCYKDLQAQYFVG